MRAAAFWKAVTVDRANLLERFFETLRRHDVPFCLIRGHALNAYVEPVVSLDLDVVVAADRIAEVETLLADSFALERFPHSLNVSDADSSLRIQIQLDPRYASFISRAVTAGAWHRSSSSGRGGHPARKDLGRSGRHAPRQQAAEGRR